MNVDPIYQLIGLYNSNGLFARFKGLQRAYMQRGGRGREGVGFIHGVIIKLAISI